ncbi:hypothetical protein [Polynucleobacter sp. MWH-Braz-FAM2G]|uniref:hypothetical protein n=1 Tax=Polynucleobacter sp. MWH-Braz-FAM2G TaxID=1855883 RepID=UPI001BFDD29B|nr:hypothetical protein [Polynucleobacter sp. MWH-Braz-FAM2G]QWD91628.1 hypothetical protein FD973_04680 [Polynucleobacter sp. MWH-Braz-FAM2G]
MKVLAAISILFALVGCATPAELRSQKPLLDLKSTKPAKDVAICIADKWEGLGGFGGALTVNMRVTTSGYVVSLPLNGQTGMLVDIDNDGTGSTTKYYKGLVLLEQKLVQAIKDCQ